MPYPYSLYRCGDFWGSFLRKLENMMVCKRNFQLRLQLGDFLSVHIHLGCTLPETKILLMVQKSGEPVDMEISTIYRVFCYCTSKKNKGGKLALSFREKRSNPKPQFSIQSWTFLGAFCLDLLLRWLNKNEKYSPNGGEKWWLTMGSNP